jgi:hypothetical protein
MAGGPATLKLSPFESRISGDLAFEAGTYTLAVKPKTGEPMTDTGQYVVVRRRLEDLARRVQQRSSAAAASQMKRLATLFLEVFHVHCRRTYDYQFCEVLVYRSGGNALDARDAETASLFSRARRQSCGVRVGG